MSAPAPPADIEAKRERAYVLHEQGDLAAAEQAYRELLRFDREDVAINHALGVLCLHTGRHAEALERIAQAIAGQPNAEPGTSQLHCDFGTALLASGRFAEAAVSFVRVLALQADFEAARLNLGHALLGIDRLLAAGHESAPLHTLRGLSLAHLGRVPEALQSYARALALDPVYVPAHVNRGVALRKCAQPQAAAASFSAALDIEPRSIESLLNLAAVLLESQRYAETIEVCRRGMALGPQRAQWHLHEADALAALQRPAESLTCFDRALSIDGSLVLAHFGRGNALMQLGQWNASLDSLEHALALAPNLAAAHSSRGAVLHKLRRWDEALSSLDRAVALEGEFAQAHSNRANVLTELRRYGEALSSVDRALAIREDFAEAWVNRAGALAELSRPLEALASYDRALELNGGLAEAHFHRANLLLSLGRYEEAHAGYEQACALHPQLDSLAGARLYAKLQLCEWQGLKGDIEQVAQRIRAGEAATAPFTMLLCAASAQLQLQAAQIWVREKYPADASLPGMEKRLRAKRLKVGYFSRDFRNHAVSVLIAQLIETHDRERIETIGFAFGRDPQDALRQRMQRAFEHFIDVHERSDREVALLARSLQLDIAVDLGGYTQDCRPGIFALRAAPLQVGYLGYLGTMGAPYMDYLIADETLVPSSLQRCYTEKILYLPHYQPNDATRLIAERRCTREECGLPPAGFVFCCFNANFKILPDTFESWMRILARVPGSVLFLYTDQRRVEQNLRAAAVCRGIDAARLVFGRRLPGPEYLARYRCADLFLDTWPYNAGTTASDALWAGLPVLTCLGEAFASRVAASLLRAIGLDALITHSPAEYESLAVALASDPARLDGLRQRLAANRLSSPLFDTPTHTRHLEAAFELIHDRCQAGLPPQHASLR